MEDIKANRKILLALGLIAVILAAANFNYLWYNLAQVFRGQPQTIQKPAISGENGPTMEPNMLLIFSLGIKVPVVYAEEISEKVFQAGLGKRGSALPGFCSSRPNGKCLYFRAFLGLYLEQGQIQNDFCQFAQNQNRRGSLAV